MEQVKQIKEYGIIDYSGIFLSYFDKNDSHYSHSIPNHALVYVYSGELVINDNGNEILINPGECVFVRRDHRTTMHKRSLEDVQYKGVTLTFKRSMLREYFNQLNKNNIPKQVEVPDDHVIKIKKRPDLVSLFESLTPYFEAGIEPTEQIIRLKLQEGIHALLATNKYFFPMLFDFTSPWKIDILDFLNENYMYELSLEEIASYTGRSLSTFKREFAQISNITPQKWIINKRLQAAYEKLQDKNNKASDIYLEVGFKNLSHFYTAFKKQFGYTPGK